MGDQYLRRLLIIGMTSLVRRRGLARRGSALAVLARKPVRVATVAMANQPRGIWAIMVRGETYQRPAAWRHEQLTG